MFNPHTHLPLLFQGDWNGSGAHTNFSTEAMRGDGGMEAIEAAIEKMSTKHMEHIKVYDPNEGADNKKRLIGSHETAAFDKFSWGVADRKASVRCKIFFSNVPLSRNESCFFPYQGAPAGGGGRQGVPGGPPPRLQLRPLPSNRKAGGDMLPIEGRRT